MAQHLTMRLEPGATEVYLPEADAYVNVRDNGLITVKKASGQECFQCAIWDMEAEKIQAHRARQGSS